MPTKPVEETEVYFCLDREEAKVLYELLAHEHVPYANENATNVIRKLSHFVRKTDELANRTTSTK